MSKALNMAELIRTRLLTAPVPGELATTLDITGLEILVDRQRNLLSDVTKAVAKARGTAVTILWQGYQVADENARTPRMEHRYTVSVWSKPVLAGENLAADEVMEAVMNRLWQWIPSGGHVHGEVKVKNGGLVPDNKFLIYDCEITLTISN